MSPDRPCRKLLLLTGLALQGGCSSGAGAGSTSPPAADGGAHTDAATASGEDASTDATPIADAG
ncbi:MAG TPA: hypothetical protein VIJ22_08985, partial [Polyangiaceae bacterium]